MEGGGTVKIGLFGHKNNGGLIRLTRFHFRNGKRRYCRNPFCGKWNAQTKQFERTELHKGELAEQVGRRSTYLCEKCASKEVLIYPIKDNGRR